MIPHLRAPMLFAAALAASPLCAQTVRGRVLDATTGEPVAAVAVQALTVEDRDLGRTRTDANGAFQMQLRVPGTLRLRAARAGYRTTTTSALPVDLRETLEVEVRISAQAVAMEPLRVTARLEPPRRRNLELNGFYERERRGFGKFVRREDFENRANQNLAQVLARVQGAAIHYQGAKQYIYFLRYGPPRLRQNVRGAPGNACLPRLYVDNVRVAYDAFSDINSVVTPGQIEAIEAFRSPAEIPVEYGGSNSGCGVILIWTRAEP